MGEERAAFCQAEHPRLVGAMTLYTGDADLAVEVAQEALARALRDWRKVQRMPAPGAWVHRVALNLAHDAFRRRRLERRALQRRGPGAQEHRDPDAGDAVAVRAAVAALPRRQRTALVLRYYSDLPVADVADLMGCSPGTVKALTHQALTALRTRAGLVDSGAEEVPDAR